MVGRDEQHIRIPEELFGLERSLEGGEHREGEVELTPLDQPKQVVVRRRLRQLEPDERPGGEEPPHHLGQDLGADALERSDPQVAALTLGERGHVRPSGVEAGDDRLGVSQQQRARFGQRHGARTARSLEQPLSDDAFERLDLLADGGLRVPERLRRAPERALPGDGLQGGQVAELDAEPTIRFHDRVEE